MKRLISYLFLISLFCGQAVCQTPQELKSFLPEITGWKIDREVEVFDSDNLFNRINGSAPLFIENNFREMTSVKYTKSEDYIVIQAYRHAAPEDAFGMYASERSPDLTYCDAGGEAQGDNAGLYFFAGSIYVKMQSSADTDDAGAIMREIAKGFAAKIAPEASYPNLFRAFPATDRIKYSETYITASFLGHEFLNKVYSCKYTKDGKTLQLFAIDGQTAEGVKEVLNKYLAFTKQPAPNLVGKFVIADKYNGDIPCKIYGQYLVGVYDESGGGKAADLLNEFNLSSVHPNSAKDL